MAWLYTYILNVLYLSVLTNAFVTNIQQSQVEEIGKSDEPLILTPYIKAGKIQEALKLSKVNLPGSMGIESYSGYFKVDDKCNSNIFFWYFPPESKKANDPTILWLQGGPGASSLFGLFNEIGPFHLKADNTLELSEFRWSKQAGLLFFDNPVCAGFSFTDNRTECYSHTEDDVRKNLNNATEQFFQLFSKLQNNDFYIFGESYAGKYIPALAYSIYENKDNSTVRINLKGLGIGDGWCDPAHQINYSSFLYNIGMLGINEKRHLQKLEETAAEYLKSEKWEEAYSAVSRVNEYQDQSIGLVDPYNYLLSKSDLGNWTKYLHEHKVKEALHTGNIDFEQCAEYAESNLINDILKSVKPWVETLVEHYPIMFYNGLLDIIVGATLTENFIQNLNWSNASHFQKEKQKVYYDKNNIPYAYGRSYGNLCVLKVRNSGHMVPSDQPSSAYLMLENFLNGRFKRSLI